MKYLDEAMNLPVFRYLLKPLDKERIFRNMKNALKLYNSSVIPIPIETKTGVFTKSAADVVFVEASNRKVIVHTLKEVYESVHNMNFWTASLNLPCFFASHTEYAHARTNRTAAAEIPCSYVSFSGVIYSANRIASIFRLAAHYIVHHVLYLHNTVQIRLILIYNVVAR